MYFIIGILRLKPYLYLNIIIFNNTYKINTLNLIYQLLHRKSNNKNTSELTLHE